MTVESLAERSYCGYPEWVKMSYMQQEEQINGLHQKIKAPESVQSDTQFVNFEIQVLLEILVSEGLVCIEQLAILTKIR